MVTSVLDWKGFFGYGTKDAWYNTTIKKITTARVPYADDDPRASCAKGEKRSPKAFWIHRVDTRIVFHYKEFGTDEKWMPFKRDESGALLVPHLTDPNGVPLFDVADCPDPNEMEEAELNIAAKVTAASESVSAGKELSSSDGEMDASINVLRDGRPKKRPPFDAPQIAETVKRLDQEIFDESGSRLFTASDLAEWEEFGRSAPTCLADIPKHQRIQFEDFSPQDTTQPVPSATVVVQLELVEFKVHPPYAL